MTITLQKQTAYGVVDGVVTPKNGCLWRMGANRYEKSTLLRAFLWLPR